MSVLSWPSVAAYCAFGVFLFYQQLHAKEFRGANQSFALVLNLSSLAAMLVGLVYLGYYGWTVVWWAPIAIFGIGLLASFAGFLVERLVGRTMLSLAGFVGWPVSAYLMFHYVP